jgi:recombinational DNA repair protein (RecF pathway)
MRHKYETSGIVLSRNPLGEANTLVTVITPMLGLVRARAQGLRKPEAKLAAALVTFAESELVLVRGKEGWRLAGAVLSENWFIRMQYRDARVRAARVAGLVARLVAGEANDVGIFPIVKGFFEALSTPLPDAFGEAAELLTVLRVLAILGLDAGDIPGEEGAFTLELLALTPDKRSEYVARINNGIAASGL